LRDVAFPILGIGVAALREALNATRSTLNQKKLRFGCVMLRLKAAVLKEEPTVKSR